MSLSWSAAGYGWSKIPRPRGRRGFAFALVVVFIPVLIGTMALAIDLGMLRVAHAEAQRAADSAALAGASAYLDFIPAAAAVDSVQGRAIDYAMRNTIRNQFIRGTDLGVAVDPANFKVTVAVRSIGLPMWFGSFFGIVNNVVTAEAAAVAAPAGGVKCVKPFAIPDVWNEPPPEDVNANRIWEHAEPWVFQPGAGDTYKKWSLSNPNDLTATSYGSQWRNQIGSAAPYDRGLIMTIKPQDPNSGATPTSGFFLPWRVGSSSGGQDYENNITGCNPAVSLINTPYSVEPGNMVGKTRQGINALLAQDPGASWDQASGTVIGCATCPGNWQASPRVVIAGLFDPAQIAGIFGASAPITFNDFGLFFVEGFDPTWSGPPPQAPVQARFIGFAQGTNSGPGAGQLLRILRLVE